MAQINSSISLDIKSFINKQRLIIDSIGVDYVDEAPLEMDNNSLSLEQSKRYYLSITPLNSLSIKKIEFDWIVSDPYSYLCFGVGDTLDRGEKIASWVQDNTMKYFYAGTTEQDGDFTHAIYENFSIQQLLTSYINTTKKPQDIVK